MRLFSSIAETYEQVNHVLTFGLDTRWRRAAIDEAIRGGGTRWLDICTGTGEMAAALAASGGPGVSVTALDANTEMLAVAARKTTDERFALVCGDATCMPFSDGMFDLVTVSFAARTVATAHDPLVKLFSEVHRVIGPAGRFVIVDTSQPSAGLVRWLFHLFVRLWVVPVGAVFAGSGNEYRYLAHTIRRFPDAENLASILAEAGFAGIRIRRLMLGAVAVHVAYAK